VLRFPGYEVKNEPRYLGCYDWVEGVSGVFSRHIVTEQYLRGCREEAAVTRALRVTAEASQMSAECGVRNSDADLLQGGNEKE
jgi:hypothetical protein